MPGLVGDVDIYCPNAFIRGNGMFTDNPLMTSIKMSRFVIGDAGAQAGATFNNCSMLHTIDVDLDMTNASYIVNFFYGCSALVNVRFVRDTMKRSISLS